MATKFKFQRFSVSRVGFAGSQVLLFAGNIHIKLLHPTEMGACFRPKQAARGSPLVCMG